MKTTGIVMLSLCGLSCGSCATSPDGIAYRGTVNSAFEQPTNGKGGPKQRGLATQIPWQLTPASTASEAQGERTSVRYVPKFGRVRGTDIALANLEKTMTAY